jgi:hypothetical protein
VARAIVLTKQLVAANASLLAASQTPVSGTALTLTGAALDTQRRILLTYGNEGAPRTLLLTGMNGSGLPISETLDIPAGGAPGTIASLQDFATVTEAMPGGGGWDNAVTLGTNGVGSTEWHVMNEHITPFLVGAQFVVLAGSVNCGLELTDDEVLMPIPIYQPGFDQTEPVPSPFFWSGMSSMAAATQGVVTHPCRAARLTVNSGNGEGQITLVQSGIRN